MLPPNQRRKGYVEVEVQQRCPLLPAGAAVRGYYHHMCTVAEERLVEGLGQSDNSNMTTNTGSSAPGQCSYSYSYSARTAAAMKAGGAAIQEGYTSGSVLGSFVHLYFASNPDVSQCIVQRCLRVDVATTTSAAATAAHAAIARLESSLAAASKQDSHPPHAFASDVSNTSNLPVYQLGEGNLVPAHMKSSPDLQAVLHTTCHQQSVDSSLAKPASDYGHLGGVQRVGSASAADISSYLQDDSRFSNVVRKSASIPSNMHQMEAQPHFQQQPRLPFAVPKRWSLDLQRLSSFTSQLLPGNWQQQLQQQQQQPHNQRIHRRSGSQGGCHPSFPTLECLAEVPLPEAASKVLDQHLPVSGKTHTKLIGLACPLSSSSLSSKGQGKPPAVAGRLSHSTSATSLPNSPRCQAGSRQHHVHQGLRNPRVSAAVSDCSHSSGSDDEATCGTGVPVSLAGPGQRPSQSGATWRNDAIISLSPAATDCIVALGLTARLAAVTDECKLPAAVGSDGSSAPCAIVCRTEHAATGTARTVVDEGLVRRIRPALVIVTGEDQQAGKHVQGGTASGSERRAAVQCALERAGLFWPESGTAILYQRCHTLSEVLEFIAVLSQAAGFADQGALLTDKLRKRLRTVAANSRSCVSISSAGSDSSSATSSDFSTSVSSVRQPSWMAAHGLPYQPVNTLVLDGVQPLSAAGSWVPEMLHLAGGAALLGTPDSCVGSQALEWSCVRKAAPDVLVISSPGLSAEEAALAVVHLACLPGWWSLPAVRSGSVFVVDWALVGRPGPRLVDGVEVLAYLLRPSHHPKPKVAPGQVLKLILHGGQRCRPRLIPNYFMQWL